MFIPLSSVNFFGGLAFSHNAVYSSLYLIVLGSDLGSLYVAEATDFYRLMSFPVGTGLATSLLPERVFRP